MSEWVYIKQFGPTVPVFHDYGKIDEPLQADVTRCGQIIYQSPGRQEMTALPQRHAERFARPCRRCFEVDA